MQLRQALQWSVLAELASRLVPPLVFIVLARLLTPEDFGVMTAAMMVIGFSQVFWEAGMGKALIQRQKDVESAADVAFWVNLGLGVAISSLLFASAGWVAAVVFRDARVEVVLQVMTLQVMLSALGSVHTALLQKSMGFRRLFWVRLAATGLPGLASIPLALHGMGYWALVGGTLLGQAAQLAMLWRMSGWHPRAAFDMRVAREMAHFGAWVGASGLMAWFYAWADSMIVGMSLGSHELGLYRTGSMMTVMVFGVLFGAMTPVLYSHLSRMNQDQVRVRQAAERVLRTIAVVSLPLAVLLFALGPRLGAVVFGPAWQGVGDVIAVMALTHGVAWIVGMNGEVYRAMGRPSYETMVMALTLPLYLGVYAYTVRFGLDAFLWARLGLTLCGVALHLYAIRRLLAVPVAPLLRHASGAAGVAFGATAALGWLLANDIGGAWSDLAVRAGLNALVIAALLVLIERNATVRDLREILSARASRADR